MLISFSVETFLCCLRFLKSNFQFFKHAYLLYYDFCMAFSYCLAILVWQVSQWYQLFSAYDDDRVDTSPVDSEHGLKTAVKIEVCPVLLLNIYKRWCTNSSVQRSYLCLFVRNADTCLSLSD